jgi:ATP-dependent helicase/DNAse subunit B
MVRGFLESEAFYKGSFGVSMTELKFGMPEDVGGLEEVRLGDPGDPGGTASFLFRGSIDRIDTLDLSGSKGFFIWDYKTGSSKEDNKSLQLPLYLLAASRLLKDRSPAGGGYYYIRRPGDIQRQTMLGTELWDAREPTREMMEAVGRSSLSRMKDALDTALDLIASARIGSFPPKERCTDRYCRFGDVCRRGDI